MKSRLMAAMAAGFLVIGGYAQAQGKTQAPQPTPMENAATPAASTGTGTGTGTGTDGYGGVPSTRMDSGAKHATPCVMDPQCNIYFGS
jgi:hypothetical protein